LEENKAGTGKKRKSKKKSEVTSGETQSGETEEAALIKELIELAKEKVNARDFKTSLGDLIRLLSLKKELEEEQIREVLVTWQDGSKEEDASKQ
jgi:hypothetical protein